MPGRAVLNTCARSAGSIVPSIISPSGNLSARLNIPLIRQAQPVTPMFVKLSTQSRKKIIKDGKFNSKVITLMKFKKAHNLTVSYANDNEHIYCSGAPRDATGSTLCRLRSGPVHPIVQ